RMFGYKSRDILGRSIEQLIVPAEREAESRWIAESVEKGGKITLETQRHRKDGSLLDVSISSAPLVFDGKVAAFSAVYRDISERKQAEALSSALYRIAENSSSARDLQQFFAAVHSIVDGLMHARNFYIALYDPANELLTFPYFV